VGEVLWWGIDLVELAVSPHKGEGEIVNVSEKLFQVTILRIRVYWDLLRLSRYVRRAGVFVVDLGSGGPWRGARWRRADRVSLVSRKSATRSVCCCNGQTRNCVPVVALDSACLILRRGR
jgi:hypothetical protein